LDKVTRIVTFFKHMQLRKTQADEGIAEGCIKTLQQNIDTRWNTCLEMLTSFLGLANKVAIILINRAEYSKGIPEMLSTKEQTICRDFCSLLAYLKMRLKK